MNIDKRNTHITELKSKASLAILMSTYNGELYLNAQLDSLLKQTCKNWTLYIRDDGSTDHTCKIIRSYLENHHNIVFFSGEGINLGARGSFLWLLENVESDYYMFCDQDDVWLSNKVEKTLFEIKSKELVRPHIPILVFADLTVVDNELRVLHKSMWLYSRLINVMKTKYLSCVCFVTGCTVAINGAAKFRILQYKNVDILHDYLAALVVARYGSLHAIRDQLILYRQHNSNAIGALGLKVDFLSRMRRLYYVLISNLNLYNNTNKVLKISFLRFMFLKISCVIKRLV